ncbi:LamG-like jellyroll fold domain-containing protein [Tumebacillus avium]|uniref:LamG-like jellyroll fold domain-containing protein n=1 Tax=Tumebacillus avium TaxID=1903704 RepID=UPI0012FDA571|nr:LamG-like jellyroll fold domain-containing protein [Tumebacillus avium]
MSKKKCFRVLTTMLCLLLLMVQLTTMVFAGSIYEYVYDSNNRLAQMLKDGQPVKSFTYDAVGNLISVKEIFRLNFQRPSVSYNRNQEVLYHHQPRMEQGYFASHASKNILPKEIATGTMQYWGVTPFPGPIEVTSERHWEGETSVRVTLADNQDYLAAEVPLQGGEAGNIYTFSTYVQAEAGTRIHLLALHDTSAVTACSSIAADGSWQRLTCNSEAKFNSDGKIIMRYGIQVEAESTETKLVYLDGLQFEKQPDVTAWVSPNRVGKAVGLENAYSNLYAAFYWLDGQHDWKSYATESATGTGSVRADTQRIEIEKTDSSSGRFGYQQNKNWITLPTGGILTDSFWIRKQSVAPGAKFKLANDYEQKDGTTLNDVGLEINLETMVIETSNGGTATISEQGGGWYQVVFTTTSQSNLRGMSSLFIEGAEAKVSLEWVRKENNPVATSFAPGFGGKENLAINLNKPVKTKSQGTWEQLVYIDETLLQSRTGSLFVLEKMLDSYGIRFHHDAYLKQWVVHTYNDFNQMSTLTFSNAQTPVGWHRIALTWNPAALTAYVDGVRVATVPSPKLPSQIYPTIYIGDSGSSKQLDTLHEDIRFSSIARSAEELASSFIAHQPLPIDEFTIFKTDFDQL